jgi:hypothetical protein
MFAQVGLSFDLEALARGWTASLLLVVAAWVAVASLVFSYALANAPKVGVVSGLAALGLVSASLVVFPWYREFPTPPFIIIALASGVVATWSVIRKVIRRR